MGGPNVRRPGHPLAGKNGIVKTSRVVLYEKLQGDPGNCNWCGVALTWKTLCADHLDGDIKYNVPENLVGSCSGCNANRDDGTGWGRRKPQPCELCGTPFLHRNPKGRFCTKSCAATFNARRRKKKAS